MEVSRVFAALGNLVLERMKGGGFVVRGERPGWCDLLRSSAALSQPTVVAEDAFPFLESFLPEAENVWRNGVPPLASSEFWTEQSLDGLELHLQATALSVDGRDVLLVTRDEPAFLQRELVLQRARELRLAHAKLTREVEMRDILVHSIVHDLASPLHAILGALSLLAELPVSPEAAELADLALQAAERERALVADILDVFSAEHGALAVASEQNAVADLGRAVREIAAQSEPAARLKQIRLQAELDAEPVCVVGDQSRLQRVLGNLMENALRHSPSGGRVAVSLEVNTQSARVNVEDDGPGVPGDVLPHLFELFAGRKSGVRGTGIGLYFCRITLERWGGGIGYEMRAEGGSRFWVRLPLRS